MTWVRSHQRRTPSGNVTQVRAHQRGGTLITATAMIATVTFVGLAPGVTTTAETNATVRTRVTKGRPTKPPKVKINTKVETKVKVKLDDQQARTTHATRFATCPAMWTAYPSGVGLWGAHDLKVMPGTHPPVVTDFYRSYPLYAENYQLDYDHDGIACGR